MNTLRASVLAVSLLAVGCSGSEDDDASPKSAPTSVVAASIPCPPSAASAAVPTAPPADAGVKLAPSAFDGCEGYFDGIDAMDRDDRPMAGYVEPGYLHRTGAGCVFATWLVLRADGTATSTSNSQTGPQPFTWTGDIFYFTATSTDGTIRYEFSRKPTNNDNAGQ